MRPSTFAAKPKFAHSKQTYPQPGLNRPQLWQSSFVVLIALLAGSVCFTSSASSSDEVSQRKDLAFGSGVLHSRATDAFSLLSTVGYASFPPPPLTVATYASDCSTPKTVFNVQDTDKTVCAKVTGATPGWRLIWSNAKFIAVQTNPITSATQDITFTLTTTSSLGDWRVIVYEPFGGTVQAVTDFTVIDAQNPVVDLIVGKGVISSPVNAGGQVLFGIEVTNRGPSTAAAVQLTDAVPANTTFVSFAQLDGPVFSCTSPSAGSSTGSTVCTIPSLNRGDKATFLATYEVGGGTPADTEISNTATIASTTSDSNIDNNSSTGIATVAPTPCMLTCPSNIAVPADSGQAGAVVTYSTPGSTGNCGEISCNPASGSFFPVGTTTVICAGETGNACSFQVTVENPGGLSISLNGANPFPLECGNDFDDPGATAVNGNGDPVPVTVSGTVNNHTPGSYVLTYTATEGQNSVSTTRTVNVSDSEAPVITLDGQNPMTVSCGQTFVDPGATANDACEGAKPVNSSGTVDTNTPGTYTITYTASDSLNHTATTTRSVVVESGGGTAPPIITLNGDPQMTTECGTAFVDPGVTATVGCGSQPDQFTTNNPVDSDTPGTYTITYTACMFLPNTQTCDPDRTTQAERTVTVQDTTAPVITLNGADPLTHECHTPFTDPGATAQDACEGSVAVTSSGTVDENTPGTYTITYSASDSGGHSTTKTRTVNVVDTTGPAITTCPPPRSANADSSCQAQVPDFTGDAVATDSCGGAVTITQSPAAGTVVGVGSTVVTITATDIRNNSSTCTTTFTVNAPTMTALGTAQIWVGLKNSDDVGTKFDLLAEVLRNGVVVGSGQINDVAGGSSGFNNAIQHAISQSLSGTPSFCPTNTLSIRLSVRVAASSGHVSGTARLWFNDAAANSRFTTTINGASTTYYLRDLFVLATTAGPGPKKTRDVFVHRNQGGNPFKPFGTWNITF